MRIIRFLMIHKHERRKRAIKKVLKKTAIPILFIGMAVISFLKNDYDTFNCMAGLYLIFCHVENVKEEIISEIKKYLISNERK